MRMVHWGTRPPYTCSMELVPYTGSVTGSTGSTGSSLDLTAAHSQKEPFCYYTDP